MEVCLLTETAFSVVLNAMDLVKVNKIAADWQEQPETVMQTCLKRAIDHEILTITESNKHPGGG